MSDTTMESYKLLLEDEIPETLPSVGNLSIIENEQSSNGSKEDKFNTENDLNTESFRSAGEGEASGGSEEEFSQPCQPCLEDNKNINSVLYCVECEDYLCEKCVEMHKVVKPSKTHKLVPKETLDNPGDELKINKKEECPYHFGEFLEWFCISDDKLCCNVCKSTEHGKCESIVAISSVAETINMQTIERKIGETQSKLKDVIEKRKVDMTNLHVDKNDSLLVLEKIKNDTEVTFLRLKQSLVIENQKVWTIFKKEKDRLSTDIKNYSRIIKGMESTQKWLRKDNICFENKFILMKKAEQYIKTVQKAILDVPTPLPSTPIGYERDKQYDGYLSAFQRFGFFDSDKRIYTCSKSTKIKIIKDQEKEATVFDICEACNDQILITDWYNGCVKLIDTHNGTVASTLETSSSPFGICKLDYGSFAVTITSCRKVIFIEVRRYIQLKMNVKRASFGTGEHCRGIAYSDEKLFVVCGGADEKEGPGHLRMFDFEGHLLKTVKSDVFGKAVVDFPWKIKIHPDGRTALVTDVNNMVQLSFNEDKTITVKRLGVAMSKQANYDSLCFDPNGRVLIAETATKSVKLLSKDYACFEPTISGLQNFPFAILLDHSNLKLYIGFQDSSDLLCFQLESNIWEKPSTYSLMS